MTLDNMGAGLLSVGGGTQLSMVLTEDAIFFDNLEVHTHCVTIGPNHVGHADEWGGWVGLAVDSDGIMLWTLAEGLDATLGAATQPRAS